MFKSFIYYEISSPCYCLYTNLWHNYFFSVISFVFDLNFLRESKYVGVKYFIFWLKNYKILTDVYILTIDLFLTSNSNRFQKIRKLKYKNDHVPLSDLKYIKECRFGFLYFFRFF